ncbi:MAG: hypothetical protein CVU77_06105 [Elusimicrobia bacterium HGW-Elusimicrobia-1]|jgi:hypothetical protein|nr:MAG: hypothetical protein CVU79_08310 [Elusimicrobia bacterium HGW-Elusimicrobia-3]PKN01252.1 MAG: hypothetical protein CVU77_06105 [Elusimicrobia bacterium HGW-Elusimicrobia-1]
MQISIVNYKTVKENSDFRYESEFWLPKYIEEENQLNRINILSLIDCVSFSNGHAFDSNEFSFEGEIYISKIGDVTQKRDFNSWERVSRKYFEEFKAKYLKHNDILMTLTGDPPDVGKVQLIFNPPKEKLSWNQRVALLRLKKQDKINAPEFLFIVLSSKYCRDHIERWAKGIRQRNVGNPAVLNMAVPILLGLQNSISDIVRKSFELLENSISLYSQAEQTLLSELGLVNWKPKHYLSFVKRFSDTQNSERIDAEYFQPKYEEVVERIKQYRKGYKPLAEIVKVKDKNFQPKDDVTYRYIELANISANGNINGFIEAQGKELPTRARRKVDAGDVIVSTIEGALSSIALVSDDLDNALCSTGFFVINSERINSETLLVLLRSLVGQLQLKKGCSGTILTAIGDDEFKRIILPDLPAIVQDKLKKKITEMYNAKALSKSLLDIAKRGVEMAIEKGEKEAESWIKTSMTDLIRRRDMDKEKKKDVGEFRGLSLASPTTPDVKNVESNKIIRKSSLASPTLPDPKPITPSQPVSTTKLSGNNTKADAPSKKSK